MRSSDGSSDVCSSDLPAIDEQVGARHKARLLAREISDRVRDILGLAAARDGLRLGAHAGDDRIRLSLEFIGRSEEHTSELQSLMRISYAVFCLKKKTKTKQQN